ncbi:MAG: 2-C-methyl-D-erythritol 4-phosphate cytidylyltransferase [Aeromonas sp.]
MIKPPVITAIVPAAGIGSRMGAAIPKQYIPLAGQPLLQHTLNALLAHPAIGEVIVALADNDRWFAHLPAAADARVRTVIGGGERADSVLAALAFCRTPWALVHDAARPCLALSDLDQLIAAVRDVPTSACAGAILGAQVRDTMKRTDAGGCISATVSREQLWHALTPQLFPTAALTTALTQALAAGVTVTDEASAIEWAGGRVQMVAGRSDNLKVTQPEDLALAAHYLSAVQAALDPDEDVKEQA